MELFSKLSDTAVHYHEVRLVSSSCSTANTSGNHFGSNGTPGYDMADISSRVNGVLTNLSAKV